MFIQNNFISAQQASEASGEFSLRIINQGISQCIELSIALKKQGSNYPRVVFTAPNLDCALEDLKTYISSNIKF